MAELDVRGEMCPYPAMKAREALARLRDETLVVLTDHAPALTTVPWEGAKAGFDPTIERAGAGEWRITLTRGAGRFDARTAMEKIARQVQEVGQ
jgi:TusA-related sulfurtransferase